ncbi:hypothetical protein L6452_06483 [Arctium lappa]|uniref:Uncharacterized protein n=1 Tax=Arctium lappa TaxID=4217 RepID=A0ACB9EJB7_ARCLA|nr:hypothetical protein L6452_06483 [Arctium lappa]
MVVRRVGTFDGRRCAELVFGGTGVKGGANCFPGIFLHTGLGTTCGAIRIVVVTGVLSTTYWSCGALISPTHLCIGLGADVIIRVLLSF